MVIEASKKLKVQTTSPLHGDETKINEGVVDKRPKKEREVDIYSESYQLDEELRMYGYSKPERIQAGRLTLRQFDDLLKQYAEKSTPETITAAVQQLNVKQEDIHTMLKYYKTFAVINKATKKDTEPEIANVFPNINEKKLSA
jgi:hypothetical protein